MLRRDRLVRVEVKPSLAALLDRPRIPGDVERLQPTGVGFDQDLLQRSPPERIPYRLHATVSRATDRLYEVRIATPKESGLDPVERHSGIGEVPKNSALARRAHGLEVV